MAAFLCQSALVAGKPVRGTRAFAGRQVAAPSNGVRVQAKAGNWLPGSDTPAYLEDLPGSFGFDPLGLGANEAKLVWFQEAERVHARWAMLGVAGILAAEIVRPDVFWYEAPTKIDLPFNIIGLVAFQLWTMHWVEVRRAKDLEKPNSVNDDPIFGNKLPDHEPGYPGGIFAPFVPGSLEEMKLKELKNGRLAMLAFIGFVMGAQVSGKNPLAILGEHIADPINTTIFSKAAIVPGVPAIVPACAIPASVNFQGLEIPTPCFLSGLWP